MPTRKPAKPKEPSIDPISEHFFSYAPSRCLTAGLQLGVFSHVAAGKRTADAVAAAAGASPRGMRMLLDSLTAMKLLAKKNGAYALRPISERFLVRESPDYAGAMMETDAMWQGWSRLTEVVRTGQPLVRVEDQATAEKFFSILVRSLHVMNRERARRTAKALLAGRRGGGLRVLDVACGSGVWGIAVAEADPKAHVTFQDFPGVLDVTREYVARHGVEGRSDYLPGNLREVDLGEGKFDVALLGNIIHSEGEASSRDLLRRLHRAFRPGGRAVIIDMVPKDDRSGPLFPIIFALNMLIHTREGDTYTLAEYTAWLREAGFDRVKTVDIGTDSPLVIGVKR